MTGFTPSTADRWRRWRKVTFRALRRGGRAVAATRMISSIWWCWSRR